MDSGNSSSLQSSSGGDEEYESVVPAFLNTNLGSGLLTPLPNPNPNPTSLVADHPPPAAFFDFSVNNYVNPYSQSHPNNSVLLNLDHSYGVIRPRGLIRSDDLGNLQGLLNQGSLIPSSCSSSMLQSTPSESDHGNGDQTSSSAVVKNPKKRTRASRRAPTTVMSTDTTNFRAMVQEFTGIPAPPFNLPATSSSYPRRLDLFGSGSLYRPLLRSSAKRPFVSSSSPNSLLNKSLVHELDAAAAANYIITDSTATTTTAFINPTNYSDLGLLIKQPHQNMLNLQNINNQSFLQPSDLNLKGGDELGLSPAGHVSITLGDGTRLKSDHGIGLNEDHLRPPLDDGNYGYNN